MQQIQCVIRHAEMEPKQTQGRHRENEEEEQKNNHQCTIPNKVKEREVEWCGPASVSNKLLLLCTSLAIGLLHPCIFSNT